MGQLSIMGLIENLSFLGPVLLFLLMPAGFIASAWVTNSVSSYFRPDVDELSNFDRFATFLLLIALFMSYCYVIYGLFLD